MPIKTKNNKKKGVNNIFLIKLYLSSKYIFAGHPRPANSCQWKENAGKKEKYPVKA